MEPQPFPIQHGKVERPLVPEDTLPRERLLDWLSAKVHSRLVLVVADAGYGKTTLLGDWTRRSRIPTAWYRLDEADADWTGFAHHLVAAMGGLDAGFGAGTRSLLREAAAGLADRAAVVRTLLGEFGALRRPAVLVLDDYQVVDGAPEVRHIVRELVLHGPDRLTVVIASRRRPSLPLARLRARGEVADLSTDDLRFDRDEIERLFRDAYDAPLEPAVLDEVAATTEGWAATLRLVEAAIRHRTRAEVARVVRSLAARQGDLHDYLAEEVVGRQPAEIAAFLERIALLDVVTPDLAAAAAGVDRSQVSSLLEQAEGSGLLARQARTDPRGPILHPLVRSFLEARLLDQVGEPGLRAIHARIARAAPPDAWHVVARHHGAAGEPDFVAHTLRDAIGDILGQGAYRLADGLATILPSDSRGAWYDILQARQHLQAGAFEAAREAAMRALNSSHDSPGSAAEIMARLTVASVTYLAGDFEASTAQSRELQQVSEGEIRSLADALALILASSLDGDLDVSRAAFATALEQSVRAGHRHYEGIAQLDLAWIERARGDASSAEAAAQSAVVALSSTSSGVEVAAAFSILGWAILHRGAIDEGLKAIEQSLELAVGGFRHEAICEAADAIGSLWDVRRAQKLIADAASIGNRTRVELDYFKLVSAECQCREGHPGLAIDTIEAVTPNRANSYPGFESRVRLARARAEVLANGDRWNERLGGAETLARNQGAHGHTRSLALIRAVTAGGEAASEAVTALESSDPALLSVDAEIVLLRLGEYPDSALSAIAGQISLRPRRWLPTLRRLLSAGDTQVRLRAAALIERSGELEDIPGLRALSHELKGVGNSAELGRSLSRRLASRVFVEDQGRVVLHIGDRIVAGTEIRRKALALLCYLISRDGLAATRDQVLEALWPDLEPTLATNSLHQTVYFLRRVIEPDFTDDLSPGYIHQSSELVWLDAELVASRSSQCRALLDGLPAVPSPDQVERVVDLYRGRFALDFAYEEWASPTREMLHAQYRAVVERAVIGDGDSGHADRALRLAQRALAVDPELDEVELSLLKLYRMTGAHAAAAEQYGHYAAVIRDELGLEPPALDDL